MNFIIYFFNIVDNSNFFGDFIVDSVIFIDKGIGICFIVYFFSEFGRFTVLIVRLFLGVVLRVVFRLGFLVVRVRWFFFFFSVVLDDMFFLSCFYIFFLFFGNFFVE